jgi:hypothetical protein
MFLVLLVGLPSPSLLFLVIFSLVMYLKKKKKQTKKRRAILTLKALLHKRNMVFSQMKERKPEPYSTDGPIFLTFFCSMLGIGLRKQYCVAGK